MTKITNHKNKK